MRLIVLLSCCLASATAVSAPVEGLVPGLYNATHDAGELVLKPGAKGKVKFRVFAEDGRGHSCEVTGTVLPGAFEAKVPVGGEDEDERVCTVRFKGIKKGYALTIPADSVESCRGFCKGDASFTRDYRTIDPSCARKALRDVRAKAEKAVAGKNYPEVVKLLSPVLDRCEEDLTKLGDADVRNDLALALFHQGDVPGCKRVLGPLKDLVGMTAAQVRIEYSTQPQVVDEWIRITQATNTTWGLCATPRSDAGTR